MNITVRKDVIEVRDGDDAVRICPVEEPVIIATDEKGVAAAWGTITGTLSDQSDLDAALGAKLEDAPGDGKIYGRRYCQWEAIKSSSGGVVNWGDIVGALSSQTDLKNALDDKPDIEDLGDLAAVDDPPMDGKLYGRKNRTWEEVSSDEAVWGGISGNLNDQADLSAALGAKPSEAPSDGTLYGRKNGEWAPMPSAGVVEWGDISGTLSDQSDLQQLLDVKAYQAAIAYPFSADVSYPSGINYVTYKGRFYYFFGPYQGSWENLISYETTVDEWLAGLRTAVNRKAEAADVTALQGDVSDLSGDVADLQTAVAGKADAEHTHDDRYYTESETDSLLAGKAAANHDHAGVYSPVGHNHEGVYSAVGHNHDSRYYTKTETDGQLLLKADAADVSDIVTDVTDLQTDVSDLSDNVKALSGAVAGKADLAHDHDGRYYTESETDALLAGKADAGHNHDSAYAAAGHDHDDRYYTETETNALLDGKQNTLTFDTAPTASSTNPVTSGGVKDALDTLDDSKVSKSGDTMTGSLRFNDANLFFQRNSVNCGQIYSSTAHAIVLRNYSEGSNNCEYFYTPTPDANLQNNKSYYFLTTKNVITTEQGGTGGTDSGWISLPANSTVYTGTIRYRKIGKWVEVNLFQIKLVSNLTTASGIVLNTLPAGYRSDHTVSVGAGNTNTGIGLLWITAGGNIQFFKPAGESSFPNTQNIYGTAMFFVG